MSEEVKEAIMEFMASPAFATIARANLSELFVSVQQFEALKAKTVSKAEYDTKTNLNNNNLNNLKKRLLDTDFNLKEMGKDLKKTKDIVELTANQDDMNEMIHKVNNMVS